MRHSGSCVLHRFAVSSKIITNYDILLFICKTIYDLPVFLSLSLSLTLAQTKEVLFYLYFFLHRRRPQDAARVAKSRRCLARRLSLSSNFTFAYNGRRLDLDLVVVVAAQLCRTALTVCNDDFQTSRHIPGRVLFSLLACNLSLSLSGIIISYFDLLFCLLFCNTFAAAADSLSFVWVLFFGNSFVVLAGDPDPAWCAFLRFAPFLQLLCK